MKPLQALVYSNIHQPHNSRELSILVLFLLPSIIARPKSNIARILVEVVQVDRFYCDE